SAGPARFYITHAPTASDRQLRIYLKLTDTEITPQGDTLVAAYVKALSPDYSFPVNYSVYGKQNIELDFSYKGPASWDTASKNPPLDIHLGTFQISNQVYHSTTSFQLTNGTSGTARSARAYFKSESAFTEQYDALLRTAVQAFIARVYATKDKDPQL